MPLVPTLESPARVLYYRPIIPCLKARSAVYRAAGGLRSQEQRPPMKEGPLAAMRPALGLRGSPWERGRGTYGSNISHNALHQRHLLSPFLQVLTMPLGFPSPPDHLHPELVSEWALRGIQTWRVVLHFSSFVYVLHNK